MTTSATIPAGERPVGVDIQESEQNRAVIEAQNANSDGTKP